MRNFCYIVLVFLLPVYVNAQEVRVKSWFDTTSIFIGDQVNYNIEISHPKDLNIIYPYLSDTLATGIEILREQGPDTLSTEGDIRVKMEYLVTSFDTGLYEVMPVYAESQSDNGVLRFYSDYTLLEVNRTNIAPSDTTQVIFDIAGPRKARITLMEILPWVLLLTAAVLAVIFLYRFFAKRKKQEAEETSFLPGEPIHIIALRDIDKLEKKELWQKSEHKKYYSELTGILRTYIDRRYGISSLEMTTSETLGALLKSGFNNRDMYDLLSDILSTADLSKFAKFKPVDTVNTGAIANARIFINNTCLKQSEQEQGTNSEGKEVKDE